MIAKNITKIEVPLIFKVIPKTDSFIDNRRHLSELVEIKQKVEEGMPLIAKAFDPKTIEPLQILDWARKNVQALGYNEKKIE